MDTSTRKVAVPERPGGCFPGDSSPSSTPITIDHLRRRAMACHRRHDWHGAVSLYQTYLQIRPADSAIWCNLGAVLRKRKQYQSAVNCYRRALELSPGDQIVTGNLANTLKDMRRLEEAIALHERVVAAAPEDDQALMNHACALREAGRFEAALAQLDRARQLVPEDAGIEWERALNLLYLGRYREGWQAYEARWQTGDLPPNDHGSPQWQGEDITGKHILLRAEQGYGDTILAARYVDRVKECVGPQGKVTLQCKPELHRLFQTLGADRLLTPKQVPEAVDLVCPMMSLMGCFDTQPDTIPPPAGLHIPEEAKQRFSSIGRQHPGCLKIGIVWSGSLTFAGNDYRALSLRHLLPLGEIPRARLYSLQKGPRLEELKESGAESFIEDLGSRCNDFADTAAAIEQLDLIVMTDSSVAHLAASLGKPVINLLERVPYWLYSLHETSTPWYPSMHLLKQRQPGEWSTVLSDMEVVIRNILTTRRKRSG